ncbi:hypothetical protein ISR94_00685 [Candidatus Microgenomates bacterium]|nr:hypothetical protein [Candidatus Microgenomates bacterium]
MKKNAKLPTILGLIILFVGLISGVVLINSQAVFKLGAQTETNPKNVRISNITNSSLTISWVTDKESIGFIKWGKSSATISKVQQDTTDEKATTHWVTILGLNPTESIYFKINSDGIDWDNNEIAWQATTNANSNTNPTQHNISGSVVDQTGNPADNVLVYVSVDGALLSTTTSNSGNWLIPLSNYISTSSNSTILEISIDAGVSGSATALIYPGPAKNTPLIVLGKSYDFRTIDIDTNTTLPESELSIPDQVEISSRFEIEDGEIQNTKVVTLESIDEGEIITTNDPEFFGKAPINTEIEIVVESEMQTTNLTPNSQGQWTWSPPNNLEPGQHKVTIKWKDDSGILRTITRNFVVTASEGPAFESTPSATPVQTSTPSSLPSATATATSTAIATISSSPTSTPPALPETGSLTPTLGLFIMGVGILLSSIFVFKTANAKQ